MGNDSLYPRAHSPPGVHAPRALRNGNIDKKGASPALTPLPSTFFLSDHPFRLYSTVFLSDHPFRVGEFADCCPCPKKSAHVLQGSILGPRPPHHRLAGNLALRLPAFFVPSSAVPAVDAASVGVVEKF